MRILAAIGLLICALAPALAGATVLLICVDGMRPDFHTQADRYGLKIPTLRRFLREGSHASGVIGVAPTVTYPAHTTLITGARPEQHGIYNNLRFDPADGNSGARYEYARDIRFETLWQAADAAGLVTASVAWPVTIGAHGIRYNIPEYINATHDALEAAVQPPGLLSRLESTLGSYSSERYEQGDAVRTRFAIQILQDVKPVFMTVHLAGVDGQSHLYGPFSREAARALESTDGMIGALQTAALANDSHAIVAVVSDHGFSPAAHSFNWRIPFLAAGLLNWGTKNWSVGLWSAGGSGAVMLNDPLDLALTSRIAALLATLAADPLNGIDRVLTGTAVKSLGGWPGAAFVIDLKAGFELGTASTGPVVSPTPGGGTHGYLPDHPDMRAAFLIMGGPIAPARDLGLVDMRRIAPTIADLLGVRLDQAKAARLPVRR